MPESLGAQCDDSKVGCKSDTSNVLSYDVPYTHTPEYLQFETTGHIQSVTRFDCPQFLAYDAVVNTRFRALIL